MAACCLLLALPATAAPKDRSARPGRVIHVVEPGQTLFRIAQAYGVPLATLVEANRLKSPNAISAGQRLVIPGAKAPVAVAARRALSAAERRDL